jgi:hypothetical protein
VTRKFPDFTSMFDTHSVKNCPNRYCRAHNYYDFETQWHMPFPNAWNFLSSRRGWVQANVHCGPGAWLPKRPDYAERVAMAAQCPHFQIDLTCNYCQRHNFRPYEI